MGVLAKHSAVRRSKVILAMTAVVVAGLLWTGTPVSSRNIHGDYTLAQVVQALSQTTAGKNWLKRAQKKWGLKSPSELTQFLRWGRVSKTDAVLTRHFDTEKGTEEKHRQVLIHLRHDQPFAEMILDLAHELVHAVQPPTWDPYDPHLTAVDYIQASIEGAGGETEAVFVECQVAYEISTDLAQGRCARYFHQGALSRDFIRKDFYRVGAWKKRLKEKLGKRIDLLGHLTEDEPQLYSSTGRAPYPIALYEEFREMTQAACENTRRRYQDLRAPASSARGWIESRVRRKETLQFLSRRCTQSEV